MQHIFSNSDGNDGFDAIINQTLRHCIILHINTLSQCIYGLWRITRARMTTLITGPLSSKVGEQMLYKVIGQML